jgi:hypothetical protein
VGGDIVRTNELFRFGRRESVGGAYFGEKHNGGGDLSGPYLEKNKGER